MLDCKGPDLLTSASIKETAPRPTQREIHTFRSWFATMLKSSSRITYKIAPWQAEIMMETNTGNRTLSKMRAQRYSKDIRSGDWQRTGEPIIFSDQGILNDGQTRLRACVLAGEPFMTDITFGVPRKAFEVTGIGAKRTLADVFSINGETNSIRLAGALNWLNGYLNGFGVSVLSHVDGMALLEKHPDIRKSIPAGMRLHGQTHLMEPSLSVFLHYIFALKDVDKADAFFEFLTEGIGAAGRTDPRLVIRERLIANKGDKAKLPGEEIAALTVKAWNAFRTGHQVRSLRWVTNPAKGTPEPFPRAQ